MGNGLKHRIDLEKRDFGRLDYIDFSGVHWPMKGTISEIKRKVDILYRAQTNPDKALVDWWKKILWK